MKDNQLIFRNLDWTLIGLYLFFIFFGWLNIYSAVYNEEHSSILDLSQNYGKQLIWIIAAFIIGFSILLIDSKVFSTLAYLFYALSLLLLISVLFLGKDIAGAKAWIEIGSFKIQPSEFVKITTNLVIARYLSGLDVEIRRIKTKFIVFLLILLPVLFILLQNDTGSALVFLAFIFVLYRFGLSGNILITGLIAIVLFAASFIFNEYIVIAVLGFIFVMLYVFSRRGRKDLIRVSVFFVLTASLVFGVNYTYEHILKPHQKERIDVLFGKNTDLKGAGYNVNQSKIAIGSGGFIGKGYMNGTQTKYDFVPQQSTDFIFCTIGEEWGFLGSTIVIGLFVWFFVIIINKAEKQRAVFARIYGYGVAFIMFIHFLINIGMALGIVPVIGIPLPFFSYGGSSLWAFTILLFIFIRQDAQRLQLI